jgi:hypothetical protein
MITQERIKELLDYDPSTGIFTWIKPTSVRVKAGREAGCVRTNSTGKTYVTIGLDGSHYQAHRLVWVYVHGSFPDDEIDHIDGNGLNNRLSNLRDASRTENARNIRLMITSTSGICGVNFCKQTRSWRAVIWSKGAPRHIMRSKDKFEAICARKSAENRIGFHVNHGQVRPL